MKLLIGSVVIFAGGLVVNLSGQERVNVRPNPASGTTLESKPEELCTLEGKIVSAATGAPVRKATVLLRRADITPSPSGLPPSYTTLSDNAGQFAMKGIEPGRYQLTVTRTGFVQTAYGARGPYRPGTTLTLAPGQRVSAIDFKLIPHAVIAGRVLDDDGEPIANVQVSVLRWQFTQGRKQMTPYGGANTNDLGEFRIFGLAPGRYYLSANRSDRMMFEAAVDSSARPGPDEGYVPTYHPGTTDPASAGTIDVVAGQQLLGMEMRLLKARTVRIRGRVNNLSNVPVRGPAMLMLVPRDSTAFYSMNRTMASGPQNRFEFRGVGPGSYLLTATLVVDRTALSSRVPIEVRDAHLDDVVVNVGAGMELRGELKVDGPPAPVNLTQIVVSLSPDEERAMTFAPPNGRVNENGTFVLQNVSPDRYWFVVRGMPEGYYIKAARIGDQDGLENGVDLTSGGGGALQIVIASGAARIEGAVTNSKQEPVAGAMVVLLPESEARRQQMLFVKRGTTDQFGRFTLKNVDPGDYRIFAVEDAEYGSWMDPELIARIESKTKRITLREGSQETADLTVIPVD